MKLFLPLSSYAVSNGEQLPMPHNVRYGIRAQAGDQSGFHVYSVLKGMPPLSLT